jgi:RimJ/RimL family protein N-acetyltransferase
MLTLRPANADDEARLLAWRNDPATREASFSTAVIPADRHARWFARKLHDAATALLVIEEDGSPVGQVRLDRVAAASAGISIGLEPEARGRGIGREALRLAVEQAQGLLGVTRITALVKPENTSSLRAFRGAGFRVVRETDEAVELEREAGPSTG